jgi:hypothetical protein
MEIIALFCSMLIGLSLGLLGSGGSILTVPIMVYLLGINPVDATGYSLFVVGITSAVGCITYVRKKLVDIKTALIFALPSILSIFFTRRFLMPIIPNPVFSFSSFTLSKESFIMLLFAVLMIVVGIRMMRNVDYANPERKEFHQYKYSGLVSIGIVAGFLTGIFGVGGGFIIIPALVLFAKIPVKMSVGTSLLIISINALVGFLGETLTKHQSINYIYLLAFTLFSVIGIFIGVRLASVISSLALKKLFGWFVIITGIFIFIKEVFLR